MTSERQTDERDVLRKLEEQGVWDSNDEQWKRFVSESPTDADIHGGTAPDPLNVQWRTDEPELCTVAWVRSIYEGENDWLAFCNQAYDPEAGEGFKVWTDGKEQVPVSKHRQWIRIITPEEERLRKRVEELEDQLRWRKWPEEAPKEDDHRRQFEIVAGGIAYTDEWDRFDGWLDFSEEISHWRPIGNLPEGGDGS